MFRIFKYLFLFIKWKIIARLHHSPSNLRYDCFPKELDPCPTVCNECGWVGPLKSVGHEYLPVELDIEFAWYCPKCGADENSLVTARD